jgi:hypothetical protein
MGVAWALSGCNQPDGDLKTFLGGSVRGDTSNE